MSSRQLADVQFRVAFDLETDEETSPTEAPTNVLVGQCGKRQENMS